MGSVFGHCSSCTHRSMPLQVKILVVLDQTKRVDSVEPSQFSFVLAFNVVNLDVDFRAWLWAKARI